MSLFRRGVEKRAITDIPWSQGGPRSSTVSIDKALSLTPVYAASNLLASNIAGMPLQAYRKSVDGRDKIRVPSLFMQPAARGTLHDWLYRAVISLALRGNAVGLITSRDHLGYPTTVEWLKPDDVFVEDSFLSGPGSFSNPIWYWRGRVVPEENLVHIPWFVLPYKVWGLSPITAYAVTVNTGLAAQDYKSDWFKAGGVPPGKFQNKSQTVNQDDAKVIKGRLVEAIRTHEPLVYGADWNYEPLTVSQADAQYVETMRLTATQIAAIYNIPPEMIGGETGKTSLTYQNVEQQAINLLQFTFLPWLQRFESVFSTLLPRPQYVKFNVDALIRTDIQTRYNTYRIARDIGLMNLDELRALEDMPPLPNGVGSDYTPLAVLAKTADTAIATRGDDPFHLQLVNGEDRDVSQLKYGRGSALWKYWTKGAGLAKWIGAVHKWTTLHRLLVEAGVPIREVDGLTTNIIEAVLPGYMKQAHQKGS